MEQKLAEYRAKKQRTELINQTKEKVKSFFVFKPKEIIDDRDNVEVREKLLDDVNEDDVDEYVDEIKSDDDIDETTCCTYVDMLYYGLFILLWCVVWLIFIKLQFGAVYFIFSAFIFIYFNTRTSKKRKHEVSAYSVFNKNCESIDGTLKAEQLERQMIYGRLT
ncbi:PREDICTED: SAYSvFN domain-containing protein 1 [Nicrophorus vespilloides]|uniref:SAYSvFN domain-containing protein 1 n=1 Tax=Nicrophorus vespilloides TaxID=110193 RepID=A0ABM1N8E1_NICVS|nr:PREDICTED: SAYSvFN domain-containing protein 1 [Nicrophorus vespilloides]